jgi:glycerophosphoryl diester phosphodiesterase
MVPRMSRSQMDAWIMGALAVSGCGANAPPTPPAVHCTVETSFFCGAPRNLAHRGGARLAPENTLAAFANAIATGADILEMDVRRTADDVVIVLHDPTVDRTTDGVGTVSSMTFAEVEALDAGYQFTADGGTTFPFRGTGVRIPTLQQVLEANPGRYFNIEIKDAVPSVAPVLDLIATYSSTDHVVIASLYDDILAAVRTAAPDILTSMSAAELLVLYNLSPAQEPSYVAPTPIAQPPFAYVSPEMIALAKRHDVIVQPWTIDDQSTMVEFLDQGVDGIITNDPVMLRDVISAR